MKIRLLIDQSIEFIKAHYEYILPFSLIYILLQLPSQFIPQLKFLPLLMMPLAFSIPYFAHKIETGTEKKFSTFFEVYKLNIASKFYMVNLVKYLIMFFLFSPVLLAFYDVLNQFNFDIEKLIFAIQSKEITLSSSQSSTLLCCFVLILLVFPLILFPEFYAILNNESILDSFKKSYQAGTQNYFKIILMLLVSLLATFIGVCMCVVGLIVALPFIYLMMYYAFKYIQVHKPS